MNIEKLKNDIKSVAGIFVIFLIVFGSSVLMVKFFQLLIN